MVGGQKFTRNCFLKVYFSQFTVAHETLLPLYTFESDPLKYELR